MLTRRKVALTFLGEISVDWSNENYIKLYTRDTPTWLKLRWQGQCLLMQLLRKVDRAGVIENITDPVDDLSLVTGLPDEVVEQGFSRLIKFRVVELSGDTLLLPNYIEAQESRKSDKQRQRESRERRRILARKSTSSVEQNKKVKPISSKKTPEKKKAKTTPSWEAYMGAYRTKYGVEIPRSAKVNSILSRIVEAIGEESSPALCRYYVEHGDGFYAQKGFPLGLLESNLQKFFTDWKKGAKVSGGNSPRQAPSRYTASENKQERQLDTIGRFARGEI